MTDRIEQRRREIEAECPGASVSIVRVYEDGSALLLYVPPEEDRALDKVVSDDWGRVTRPVELFVPPEPATADRKLN
jgi:hypothetical protein